MWVILLVLLIGIVLAGLFWVGALTLQGWWYSEPSSGMFWRAPAAGAAIALFIGLWCFINVKWTDPARENVPFGHVTEFSFSEDSPPTGVPFFYSVKNGKTTVYVQQAATYDTQGRPTGGATYTIPETKQPWKTGDAEGLVKEVKIPYPDPDKPDDPKAHKTRDYKLVEPPGGRPEPGKYLTYKAEDGETITEVDVMSGKVSRTRWGLLFGYVLLHLLLFAVVFAAMWLLLRFQWAHALGLSFIVFLVLTLGVFKPLFDLTHAAAKEGAPEKPASKKLVPPTK
jgi:hypothetical protein